MPPLECLKVKEGTNWSEWVDCEPAEACKSKDVIWWPIKGHKYHLYNWYDDFDIICASELETGLIGAAVFAGMLLGAIVFSPLSDSIGWRPTHILGLSAYLVGCSLMYFYTIYWSVVVGCLFIGIGMYGWLVVSYLYCLELVDEAHSKIVATIAMTLNASCSGFVALYYIFGVKDAEFQIIIALGITLVSLSSFACLPESPKLKYD